MATDETRIEHGSKNSFLTKIFPFDPCLIRVQSVAFFGYGSAALGLSVAHVFPLDQPL